MKSQLRNNPILGIAGGLAIANLILIYGPHNRMQIFVTSILAAGFVLLSLFFKPSTNG